MDPLVEVCCAIVNSQGAEYDCDKASSFSYVGIFVSTLGVESYELL